MLAYSCVLTVVIALFVNHTSARVPLQVDVIRDRGIHLFRDKGNDIENVYTVKLNNMSNQAQTYELSVTGDVNYQLHSRTHVYLEAGEIFTLPLRISAAKTQFRYSKNPIKITARATSSTGTITNTVASQKSWFYAPKQSAPLL
jgi:polyferredoxin